MPGRPLATWSLVRPPQKQALACPGRAQKNRPPHAARRSAAHPPLPGSEGHKQPGERRQMKNPRPCAMDGDVFASEPPLRLALVRQLMPVLETLREPGVIPFIVRLVVASAVSRRAAIRPPAKAPGSPSGHPAAGAPDGPSAPCGSPASAVRRRPAAQPPPRRGSAGPRAPADLAGARPPSPPPDHTGSLPSVVFESAFPSLRPGASFALRARSRPSASQGAAGRPRMTRRSFTPSSASHMRS